MHSAAKQSMIFGARRTARSPRGPVKHARKAEWAAKGHLDHVDKLGKGSLRCAGHMHHLGVGIAHARKP